MSQNKIKTAVSKVEVYKVLAPTMKEAFQRLSVQNKLDDYTMQRLPDYDAENVTHGFILKTSQKLHFKYLNNTLSEFSIFGGLYTNAPKITTDEKVVVQNIIAKGTKKWETINSYRTDSNEVVFEDVGTKAEALEKAKELAIEHGKTINATLSKRLVDHDGILGIAEFIPYENIDLENVYVFWKYGVEIVEILEEENIEEQTIKQEDGQIAIKDTLLSYYSRQRILNSSSVN